MPSDSSPIRSERDPNLNPSSNPIRSLALSFEPPELSLRAEKKPVKKNPPRDAVPFADDGDPLRALSLGSRPAKPEEVIAASPQVQEKPLEDDQIDTAEKAKANAKSKARAKIPVGRKVEKVKIPKLDTVPEEEIEEPIFTKREAIAWGVSIAFYTLFLIFLATQMLSNRVREEIAFTTSLPPGGSPFGDDAGLSDKMGGVEVPPALPEIEGPMNSPFATAPTLSSLADAPPDAKAILQPTESETLGGDGLTGKGKGGGTGGEGFGLARFGSGTGEKVQGVQVKVGDPQFTLIWDSKADLDLHVIEPGSSEIYWEKPRGDRGGELDVDDQDGFGPENVYWGEERGDDGRVKVKGKGPLGSYKWFVVYYGGFGGNIVPTHWKVRVKHDGIVNIYTGKLNAFGQRSRMYTLNFNGDAEGAVESAEKIDKSDPKTKPKSAPK